MTEIYSFFVSFFSLSLSIVYSIAVVKRVNICVSFQNEYSLTRNFFIHIFYIHTLYSLTCLDTVDTGYNAYLRI